MPHLPALKRRARPLLVAGLTGLALLLGAGMAHPAAARSVECDYLREVVRSGGTVWYWPEECGPMPGPFSTW